MLNEMNQIIKVSLLKKGREMNSMSSYTYQTQGGDLTF